MRDQDQSSKVWLAPQRFISLARWEQLGSFLLNFLVICLLVLYLFPVLFMVSTAFMEPAQLGDRYAPPYPARQQSYDYQGQSYLMYQVPFEDGIRQLALVNPGRTSSEFIDPADPGAGLISWQGSWRTLSGVYRFHLTWENFSMLFRTIRFEEMLRNTLLLALITEIGVLLSSVVVAYGFARFPLPGGDLFFYILIATMLIPEKVTLIPSYFFFVRVLHWDGTWWPLVLPFFFGSAVFIFLLRQNFRSIPKDLDEAAMLDGAGPLRILFSVMLPQSWPVIITVGLLHFFYVWNETRQAALYLSTRRDLAPISFGIQNFQSLAPIQNVLQASALLVMIVPVIVLLVSQRFFMQDMVITGMER
ncbi:MAG: carbohydrate ABC transporter permease [Anaerolineales bacterium]|nr:carbohydrate ABC transporter permease [Anaerolineales bacterium]